MPTESSPRPYMLRQRRVKFCRRVPYYNLAQLPSEVLLQLVKYLPLKDLLALKQVSIKFSSNLFKPVEYIEPGPK